MPQFRPLIAALVVPLLATVWACEEKPSTTPAPATPAAPAAGQPPAASPAAPAAAPAASGEGTVTAAGVVFKLPEGWKSVSPSNQMRIAEVQVPDASADPAKACVIAFSTAGGDVQSNITRWAGQMIDATGQAPKPEIVTRDIGGLKVHTVTLKGAYQGMGETPKPDWALHGAIVETGPTLLFVKMTGPAPAMDAARPGWDSMISSATKG